MGCKDNFSFCYSFKNRNNVFFFYFFTYSFFLRTFLFANSEMDINNSEAMSFWMRYLMQMLYPKLLYIVSFLIYSTEVWLVIWNNICCFPGKWYLIILVQSRPVFCKHVKCFYSSFYLSYQYSKIFNLFTWLVLTVTCQTSSILQSCWFLYIYIVFLLFFESNNLWVGYLLSINHRNTIL